MNDLWTEATRKSHAKPRACAAATRRWRLISGLLLGLCASNSYAQAIERLADIETGAGPQVSSFPGGFGTDADFGVLGDGRVLFAASDPLNGNELRLSTGASVVLVRDIAPGSGNGSPGNFVAFDGRVWFGASDPGHGQELWVSDGSPAGTRRVTDLVPGGESSGARPIAALTAPALLIFSAIDASGPGIFSITADGATLTRLSSVSLCGLFGLPGSRVSTGNRAFFGGRNALNGCEPYVSDGTPAGTQALGDLATGAADSTPTRYTQVGNNVYFSATNSTAGRELWFSDGTPAGTRIVADLAPGNPSSDPSGLIARGNVLLFIASDASPTRKLRSTDGTTISTIEPAAGFSAAGDTVNFGSETCFTGNDGSSGSELWCSDGSGAGTRRVADLIVGSGGSSLSAFLVANVGLGPRLFFNSTVASTARLAVSNGTAAGTQFLVGGSGVFGPVGLFAGVGGQAIGRYRDAEAGDLELWRSDGSVLGTTRLADIGSAPGSSLISRIVPSASSRIGYFTAFRSDTGYELWRTDGTAAGTRLVTDLAPGATDGMPGAGPLAPTFETPLRAIALGERLLFSANDGVSGGEPWVSDGSAAGTQKLAETLAGNNDSESGPSTFAVRGGHAYFFARTSTSLTFLRRLFRTDGTPQGTIELAVPADVLQFIGPWIPAAGTLFIAGRTAAEGEELWRLNAAGDALVRVVDLAPGTAATSLRGGIERNGTLLFAAAQQGRGIELFVSDGSAPGTAPLLDLAAGVPSSLEGLQPSSQSPFTGFLRSRNAIAFGTRVFYPCDPGGGSQFEPCSSDGTDAGTGRILDLETGAVGSIPLEPVGDGTRVWFIARRNGMRSIHVTDGSAAGTLRLDETAGIEPSGLVRLPGGELVMAGNLRLEASDFGQELFAGDPGAIRGFNLAAADLSSSPEQIARIGDFALFRASIGVSGNEPYVYKPERVFADGLE
jgi:ELWxxDGT repeat protein